MRSRLALLLTAVVALAPAAPTAASTVDAPRVLVIAAHPDDETLFNLSRFSERGWPMAVALVTNGEGGAVVQSIRPDYDPVRDPDALVEKPPGPDAWLTTPPDGPRLRTIGSPTALARERRREFLKSLAVHRVQQVYLLSQPQSPAFEDSWDNGVRRWDKHALRRDLAWIARRFGPDLILTLNPGETWAHPQHVGLGNLVRKWRDAGALGDQPPIYGLREHAWYVESMTAQPGDLTFDRGRRSPVLGTTYDAFWRRATSPYLSQSSHPVWLDARAAVGILPGYRGIDILRRVTPAGHLRHQLRAWPPNRAAYESLARKPVVTRKMP